ncbi:MAG TPA: glycosyltransferase family 2 protein [bacterium]|jgi:glycosyltransferase involved in cell wall biosynthesis|nr:glycosyltransferase family 2 protein [bacterium]
MKREAVTVIIPAFNEERGVGDVVRKVRQVLRRAHVPHELFVVDDGSKDQTGLKARQAGAHVISMGENRGYGASLKAGMRQARYNLIAMLDADGTYPPEELPELLRLVETSDMAVGARIKPNAAIPFLRRFPKWLLGKWANYLAERKIPDLNSGLRVFRKNIAGRYEGLFPNGFSFTTTLTLALECHGYVVKYHPITYAVRIGTSKIKPIQDTINFFSLVLRVVMYFKPLKIFIPLSGIIFLCGVASGIAVRLQGRPWNGETLFLLVASLQVAALGLLADLLVKRGR